MYFNVFSDIPMSVGILNIRSQGSYTNELEFEWDTQLEAQIYVKVTKGRTIRKVMGGGGGGGGGRAKPKKNLFPENLFPGSNSYTRLKFSRHLAF